ncbi:MAG: hypothetical protein QF437_29790, partial [Planctomycetota bacterium]|nr:hypothetical protein [Planctomycetota bacterium]
MIQGQRLVETESSKKSILERAFLSNGEGLLQVLAACVQSINHPDVESIIARKSETAVDSHLGTLFIMLRFDL